ncbi:MAG TPA: hypothetical protein VK675_00100 [Candidatus Paceibacterota bacterium]|nr:hypothetical protein [Candidatus Paceibacterota bacterium]
MAEAEDEKKEDKKSDWFLWLIGASCLVAIVVSFYFFYFKKDYDFIVEVACDPSKEICFQRDCTNPDDCPPNGLSVFKRYSLNAADFKMCKNEDCTDACAEGTIKCSPVECVEDPEVGESCSTSAVPATDI